MFNEKVIDEMFNNHSKALEGSVHKEYMIGEDIIVYIHQSGSRITMSALSDKTDRQLYLKAARYKKIIARFEKIAKISTDKCWMYIDLIQNDLVSKVSKVHIERKQLNSNAVSKIDMTPTEDSYNSNLENEKVSKVVSKVFGYCRVSTKKQVDNNSLEQQETEIFAKYNNAEVYKEQFTGFIKDRPIFNDVVSKVSKGDTLVVTRLDRLARNTKEGIEIIETLFKKGVAVHVLNIGLLEDTTMGKFFLTTMLAVSEMERSMIIERTQAGKEIAKTKAGFKEGRPKKYKKIILNNALSLLSINGGELSYKEVERQTGISKSTLIRANKKANQ